MSCSCDTVHQSVSTVNILQVTKCWGVVWEWGYR